MKSNQKSRSVAPTFIMKLAGSVLVLVAAVAVGIVIREYRLKSYLERLAQAQKAAQPANQPKTRQTSNEPGSQDTQGPMEEVLVEAEALMSEPNGSPTSIEAGDGQSEAGAQAETAAAPTNDDSGAEDSKSKEKRARAALALIGYDREADEVWIQVINDPGVSANARSNLIEDLNEDGFSDPHNTTRADLPVIEYRIGLIEELEPHAMDKVNRDAFHEAHKDLVNMVTRITGR